MHSEFRRMPAERPVNDPYASPLVFAEDATTNSTTTTSQSTTAKTTSTTSTTPVAVSSTAKTSSSQSSASASTSQTLTSSASLQPTPTSTLASPSTTLSTSSPAATGLTISPSHTTSQSVVFITTTPSATATAINNVSSASSQTLSGGALGGIIAASIVVALALIIFIVRKTYLRRRQNRRLSWPAGNIFNETKPLPAAPSDDFSEKPASLKNSPKSPFVAHGQSQYPGPLQPPIQRMQSPFTGYAGPAPPPASYNNPMPMYSQPPPPSLSPGDSAVAMARAAVGANLYSPPAPTTTPIPMFPTAPEAVVNRAFIPTLPDELSVTAGERIHVLAQYDDAWALCVNGRGEQGMVPQECLDRPVASNQPDWRNAGRTSSLVSDGRRY
ncbi:uncharacterized protein F5147DRAFT_673490 [Suillus discolor]|uniref:SH3 domain-containing protein n=1 Tax=Suillus discolor TaxID=1912936 RepID=A0A9P7JYR2_9AGAM|nr:uncharacterized protein F5147DRAFT_673490 [Suillus discolor]KAG2116572.1 hypothetical protein F5147DRAFT_673490 [Suillus discolor]